MLETKINSFTHDVFCLFIDKINAVVSETFNPLSHEEILDLSKLKTLKGSDAKVLHFGSISIKNSKSTKYYGKK